ncbi:MAG: hypothetical protein U0T07_09565 [Chitinophagales bacterium]
MKHIIYFIATIALFTACKQKANNESATEITTEAAPIIVDTSVAIAQQQTQIAEQPKKENSDSKNLTLIFKDYSEGDYPHFLFEDKNSKEEYDFRFLSDNNLGSLPLLLDDEQASFGLKANPKFIGKVFNVNIFKKDVLDSDLEGNTIKSKEWVIKNISLIK